MSYDYSVKIIVLGDAFVGKTALIESLIHNTFTDENTCSTIGVEFESKIIKIGNKRVKAMIWDTAGQEVYRSLIDSYYRGCAGAIIVFDVTMRKSFENLKYWLDAIHKNNPGKVVSIILVANKIDKSLKRVISKEMIEEFCHEEKLEYFETSAKTNTNTKIYFNHLLNNILINNMTITQNHDGIKCITYSAIKERDKIYYCPCSS